MLGRCTTSISSPLNRTPRLSFARAKKRRTLRRASFRDPSSRRRAAGPRPSPRRIGSRPPAGPRSSGPTTTNRADAYARNVAAILVDLDCEVSIIDAREIATRCVRARETKGFDAADALDEMAGRLGAAQAGDEPRQAIRSGTGLSFLSAPTRWTRGALRSKSREARAKTRRAKPRGSLRRSKSSAHVAIRTAAAGARCCGGATTTGASTSSTSGMRPCMASRRRFAPSLADVGLRIARTRQRDFVGYLSAARVKRRVTARLANGLA